MTKHLLWEIGLEEVPARFLPAAVEQMHNSSASTFAEAGLTYSKLQVFATPRRLTLLVHDLIERTADLESEVKGPAVKSAYDAEGQPTRALQGFCQGQGLQLDQLLQKEIKGNMYVYAMKKIPGRTAQELLPELLPAIAGKLNFPKNMRWGYHSCRFVRPVHWMVCLLGSEIVPVQFADITAANISRGHRLLGSDHIEIADAEQYIQQLRSNYVIVDQNERRELCWQGILRVAQSLNGTVREDDELLEEVTYLVEYPTALCGRFEEKYLALPQELVITPMREHQRYFPVHAADGSLLPNFITVRNGDDRFLDIVAEGNENVLRARLADAEFFYAEDLKNLKKDKLEQLSKIVFHEKLGTMGQKVYRIMSLADEIGRRLGFNEDELAQTRRAAYLAKFDLCSRVVYEFPELQGIIGEYYALASGEDAVVAQAVREHYLPRFSGDELPQTKPGIAVALADKIDNISGFFSIDMIPTGSQDPYALRRAAGGCAQIILKHKLRLKMREVLFFATEQVVKDMTIPYEQREDIARVERIVQFIFQRLETQLSEDGISYDVINAITNVGLSNADLLGAFERARALNAVRSSDKFISLREGFTRAANILRSDKADVAENEQVEPNRFVDESEKQLYSEMKAIYHQVAPLIKQGDYSAALEAASSLTPYVNKFFDSVMVMDENADIRRNRLALLGQLVAMTDEVGDLSKLVD